VHLPQEWDGDFAFGSGSYQALTHLTQNERFLQRDLDLEWKTACLHGNKATEAAQLLTLNIKAVDGKPLDTPSGFTISFKQHTLPPTLLRLESVPNPSASNKDVAESWREPSQALRLIVSESAEDSPRAAPVQSLEDDIRDLRVLEIELEVLQSLVAKKKKWIHSRLRTEVQNVSQEISHCDSVSCIFNTIARKALGAWRIAYIRFKPNQEPINMGRPEHAFAQAHDHVAQVTQVSNDSSSTRISVPQAYTAAAVCPFFSTSS
jgi:hypothetical protein